MDSVANKNVVIVGLGRSALAMAKLLHSRGAKVKISEVNPKDHYVEAIKELAQLQPEIEMEFGRHSLPFFEGADLVVVSPSVRLDEKPLDEVRQSGVPICSDIELVLQEVKIPVVAVAGSLGKTIVAELLKTFLQVDQKKVFVCSDLAEPIANYLLQKSDAAYLVLELSPEQIENLRNLQASMVILTNTTPPFPERYPTAEEYSRVLSHLLRITTSNAVLTYNLGDTNLRSVVTHFPNFNKRVFRRKDPSSLGAEIVQKYKGCYLTNHSREMIWTDTETRENYNLRFFSLFGAHNKDNLMAAVIAAKHFRVPFEAIQRTIDGYLGVEHRLELVKKKGGVRFINDSRSVNMGCLRNSLESFPYESIILIAGGKDNQVDFSPLADLVRQRVKTMILIGEAKEHMNRCLGDYSETFLVGTFEEAILLSYQKSREGDIILLSPGCESYDMFVSYEERGNYFKKYVTEL